MMPTRIMRVALLSIVAGSLVATAACVDEQVVFRDRELFEDPLDAAGSFLGYSDSDDKLTVCGNCHIGTQQDWVETAHASAWDGLQDSGHAQGFCEGCHTVGELGNVTTGTMGHAATGEARYEDVQCEACHGPGLAHVEDPNDATVPSAPMDVGLDLTSGCAECHQGAHHPFADEWSESGHGQFNSYPAGRADCSSCHTGEGALEMFGVNTTYLEQDDVAEDGEHLSITCAVCHDPHGSDNPAQLRFATNVPNEDQNLCMMCHNKRGTPDPTTFRGPHAPEGPTLLGVAGWWPSDMSFPGGRLVGTHGTPEANPGLCASCHVQSFEIVDQDTEELVFQSTGHSFEATPCVDADGIPTGADGCQPEERSYQGCTASGCHGSADVARNLQINAENRIAGDADDLESLIAQIPESEFDETDDRYTVGEGAQFNLELARSPGAAVHNPFLIEALLQATIDEVESRYGLGAPARSSEVRGSR
ncbi:MAG: cytochrome c3 family protein [Gemmatimonadota bacterium]|nr:cytochrome c3 family protein [Gemmatimonadota bacterium]